MGNDKVSFIVYSVDGISIHVPSWGTTAESLIWPLCILFQSTFPRGERLAGRTVSDSLEKISIHVPSWGTTMVNFNATQVGLISIHVPSWGTTTKPLKDVVEELFQSTFPRGERHTVIDTYKRFKDFNPRSLVGNDKSNQVHRLQTGISIHVPSWGTTTQCYSDVDNLDISIHVPSWGTTKSL